MIPTTLHSIKENKMPHGQMIAKPAVAQVRHVKHVRINLEPSKPVNVKRRILKANSLSIANVFEFSNKP